MQDSDAQWLFPSKWPDIAHLYKEFLCQLYDILRKIKPLSEPYDRC